MTPVKVALIGCGRRGQHIYIPILKALKKEVEWVAVVDRDPQMASLVGLQNGVRSYDSIGQLVADRPMEAAIVVTPLSSHHAISCFLSRNRVHHLVETPICDTVVQAREMVALAETHAVFCRIGEQFFRDPIDQLSRQVVDAGVIGAVGRITHYQAHLGYHNNSRHQVMAGGSAPLAVNCITHAMRTAPYLLTDTPMEEEIFRNVSYHFENGLLITDIAGNIKGALGRYPRPGYMEIDGAAGSIVAQANQPWNGGAEVRLIPPEESRRGLASSVHPFQFLWRKDSGEIVETLTANKWDWEPANAFVGARVSLPQGEFSIVNPLADSGIKTAYHSEVAAHLRDFATLVRIGTPDLFTPDMAVNSLLMEQAAELSARRKGARVRLDDAGIAEIDDDRLQRLKSETGIDPRDIEAMMNHCFPRP